MNTNWLDDIRKAREEARKEEERAELKYQAKKYAKQKAFANEGREVLLALGVPAYDSDTPEWEIDGYHFKYAESGERHSSYKEVIVSVKVCEWAQGMIDAMHESDFYPQIRSSKAITINGTQRPSDIANAIDYIESQRDDIHHQNEVLLQLWDNYLANPPKPRPRVVHYCYRTASDLQDTQDTELAELLKYYNIQHSQYIEYEGAFWFTALLTIK